MSHAIRDGLRDLSARPGEVETPSLQVLRSVRELEPLCPQLDALARESIEPNPFYEPWMLLPALRRLFAEGEGARLRLVVIRRERTGGGELVGFFPMELGSGVRGLPLRTLRLLRYAYSFSQKPLVRLGAERVALAAWLEWARRSPDGAELLELEGIGAEGPLHRALLQAAQEAGLAIAQRDVQPRAFLRPAGDAESYLREALGGKRLKELRRQARRLEEEGPVTFRELAGPGDGADAWIEAFLKLEASGWKGEAGGAFLSCAEDAAFFRDVAREGLRQGRLRMLGLEHAGAPVAINVNLLAGSGAFAFKTAYDERFARFAPGLLLEIENVRRLHAAPEVRWFDSCALPENEMANRLFADRTLVHTLLIGCRPLPGGLAVSALPLLQWAKQVWGKQVWGKKLWGKQLWARQVANRQAWGLDWGRRATAAALQRLRGER